LILVHMPAKRPYALTGMESLIHLSYDIQKKLTSANKIIHE